MGEVERCPLCETRRPRGAPRCVCNYVFEYARAPIGRVRGAAAPALTGVLLAAAATAGMIGLFWIRSQPEIAGRSGIGLLCLLAGAFTLCGAVMDWRWFFNARRARVMVGILGRTGARVLYAALGGGLIGIGMGLGLAG